MKNLITVVAAAVSKDKALTKVDDAREKEPNIEMVVQKNNLMEEDENMKKDINEEDDLLPAYEEPDVMSFDNDEDETRKNVEKNNNKESMVEKIKAWPLWLKAAAIIVLVSLFFLKDEFKSKNETSQETELTPEMNLSSPQEIKTEPQAEQSQAAAKLEKLNGCLMASQISFKYETGRIVPLFGAQDISNQTTFCDEFTLKDYKMDTSGNSLSVVGDVYSGSDKIKSLSIDPLAYYNPTYYMEGIGVKHPNTGKEVLYMQGESVLSSQDMKLVLTGIKDLGSKVEYDFTFNGQSASITVDRKLVL